MADNFAARKSNKYEVVCLLPDVCLTPGPGGIPTPYPITIKLDGAAGVSPNVNFNGKPAFLYDQSDTVKVEGDEPGQGKGIASGTVGEKAEPISHSPSVRINKKQLVRENDLFFMNNKNTIGKLTTTESGGESHITDDGKIAGNTLPEDLDEATLLDKVKDSLEWVEKQKQDFNQSFNETIQEEFKDVIETGTQVASDPVGYANELAKSGVEAGQEAIKDAEDIARINAERSRQLYEQFQTDPAGAVEEYYGDLKDEAAILKDELKNKASEIGDDLKDWGSELGDKIGNAVEVAKQGDIGKAAGVAAGTTASAGTDVVNPFKKAKVAGEVTGTAGSAAKKAALLKKKKMEVAKKKKQEDNEDQEADKKDGGKSKKGGKSIDPPGTKRNSRGQLYDEKTGKFVDDPNTVKFNRSAAERRKALLRDAKDPNSGLSDRARKQILDSNGKKVPKGYEVDHKKPLYTKKTIEGKRKLDKADNLKTIRKSEHKKLHTKCNKVKYHKYPPNRY